MSHTMATVLSRLVSKVLLQYQAGSKHIIDVPNGLLESLALTPADFQALMDEIDRGEGDESGKEESAEH